MNSQSVLIGLLFATIATIHADDACGGLSYYGPQGFGWRKDIQIESPDGDYKMYFYWPAHENGSHAYDNSGAPYPVISFAHGFASPDMEYESYMEHLASWGYFVVAPDSHNAYMDKLAEYTANIHQVIEWIKNQNEDPNSELYQQVDVNSIAIVGHSMGGVATTMSASNPYIDPALKAIVPIAGSAEHVEYIHNITVPTHLITGTADTLMPSALTTFSYDNMKVPKIHSQIIGGWHCGFMDESVLLPDDRCHPEEGWMDRETQLMLTRCLMMPFLHQYVKGVDCTEYVWGPSIFSYDMVNVTTQPWVKVDPQIQQKVSSVGETVIFRAKLTNVGLAASSFTLQVAETTSSATVAPSSTSVLKPGETAIITITLDLDNTSGDSASFYAIWDADGATQQYFQVSVSSD